ncbi:hypothetical protein D9M71_727510 [compost metagenome]
MRAGAGDHQAVVVGFEHGEVQAGTQAAQGFYGQVGWMADGQQRCGAVGTATAPFIFVFFSFLQNAVWDRRIDRQAHLLDSIGVFQATVQSFAQQY